MNEHGRGRRQWGGGGDGEQVGSEWGVWEGLRQAVGWPPAVASRDHGGPGLCEGAGVGGRWACGRVVGGATTALRLFCLTLLYFSSRPSVLSHLSLHRNLHGSLLVRVFCHTSLYTHTVLFSSDCSISHIFAQFSSRPCFMSWRTRGSRRVFSPTSSICRGRDRWGRSKKKKKQAL